MCDSKRLCDDEECQTCFEKSFASHSKSKFWSDKNKLKPRKEFKISGKKYWFYCDECNHEFNTVIASITTKNNASCDSVSDSTGSCRCECADDF